MKLTVLLLFLINSISFSAEVCSRVAKINYQEVLVDAGNGKKGEGLRFYLEKDNTSKTLLNEYQKKNSPSIWNAATSTIGSVLILTGLLQTGGSNSDGEKDKLIFFGATIIGVNYLINKTMQISNEKILDDAVQQYNKRNTPKIYFSPLGQNGRSFGISAGIIAGF